MGFKGFGRRAWLVALLVIGAAWFLFFRSEDDGTQRGATDTTAQLGDPAAQAEGADALSEQGAPAAAMPAPLPAGVPAKLPPVDPVDPPELRSALPTDTLFAPDPRARAHFASRLSFGWDDRHYLEFNRAALATLRPGSTLTVRMPDTGEPYRIAIESVEVHPNGDKSWAGRIVGAGRDGLPVLFTQGADASFGSIQTPTRSYRLEADGRMAWIADENALRRHQDFSQPDVRVPDALEEPPPPRS